MATTKVWRVESRKYSSIVVKQFTDEGAAKRYFQKFKNARLTEFDVDEHGNRNAVLYAEAGTL